MTTGGAARRLGSAAITAALLTLPVIGAAPAQAYSSQQWALDYLKANQDWSVSKGAGSTVAVVDTGVAQIADLNGQVTSGADFSSGTTSSGDGRTDTDSDGHGTGIASIIAGNGAVEGLAPAAKVLAVRVDTAGTGTIAVSNVAAGIQYAISNHVGVINLSLRFLQDPGNGLQQAIEQAIAASIVVVAGVGNDSSSSIGYPAAYPGVVAVGAIDSTGQIWSQSNTGAQVTLAAPGVSIYRDNNFGAQGTSDGTSEATAYVSAAAALIRSAHPTWTAGQVIRGLIATADPASGQTAGQHSDQYGFGILDPLKALQAAAPTDTTNPLLGSTSGGTSATATPGDTDTATTTGTPAASTSHTGLIIGGIVAIVVIVGVVLLIMLLARGRGGPKPPTGPGGGGYPQTPPYQRQNPYQQNPYQQQPQQQPQYPQQGPPPQHPPQYPQQLPPQQQ